MFIFSFFIVNSLRLFKKVINNFSYELISDFYNDTDIYEVINSPSIILKCYFKNIVLKNLLRKELKSVENPL